MKRDRLIEEVRAWDARTDPRLYSILRRANALAVHGLERTVLRCLARAGIRDLERKRFLDVGCGLGGQLLRWIQWGARPENCHGVDLVAERLAQARHRLPPAATLLNADAGCLPFPDLAFDVVSQLTVLSSIPDDPMQEAVAREMLRVTRPDGLILSYDFWLNPINPATRGVRVSRLRRLFPGCRFDVHRITLAPPIARRLAPVSPLLCRVLEGLKLLNTHRLVLIRPARPA